MPHQMRNTFLQTMTFLLVACSTSMQGPLDALQLVAWTTMIVDYSQEKGLKEGLQQTFSGEAPCSLCLSISDSRETQPEDGLERSQPPCSSYVFLETPSVYRFVIPPVIATWSWTQSLQSLDLPPPEAPPPRWA